MPQRNFPEYGPMQRRRSGARPRQMATPMREDTYTGPTIPMRTVARRPVAVPASRQRRSGSGWWWKAQLIMLALLIGAAFGGLTWLDREFSGRIYPNVSLQGVNVSRMTIDEAAAVAEERYGAFLERPISIAYQGRVWEPTAEDLGIRANLRRAVTDAYNAGRGNGLTENVTQVASIYQSGLDLPLRITVDGAALTSYLQRVAAEVEQPGTEAVLAIHDAQVQSSDSINGRMVLIDETTSDIVRSLQSLEPRTVTLRTSEIRPQLTTQSIAEARRTTEAMLATPLQLRFQDTTYELDQAAIADMIVLQRMQRDNGTILNAQLDQEKLQRWVTRLADRIGRSSVEPRVAWNGGSLQIIREGRIGYRLDVERTVEMINGAITTISRKLDLPVEEVSPRVTAENLNTLGIREVVGSGKSDFTGSAAYRVTNIKVGVQKMNGILIAPGEEFSFNENVGSIDEANGFVEGYAIVGNRTQLEPGGGICQDSTTLFRAAFYAGLPFTEWHPHRFRISWYEKYDTIGMDSTIYTGGGPDLRFVNDTGNWLLIQGYVNDAEATVTFVLYGTRVPGRTVERTDPRIANETPAPTKPVYIDDPEVPVGEFKQTDTARGGMEIEIIRTVKQDGKVVRETPFRTKFEAWPNIFLKNPKTPAPPGA
jgi:vancomycin resistance protein YoaR